MAPVFMPRAGRKQWLRLGAANLLEWSDRLSANGVSHLAAQGNALGLNAIAAISPEGAI